MSRMSPMLRMFSFDRLYEVFLKLYVVDKGILH